MPCEFCEAAAAGLVALSEELDDAKDMHADAERELREAIEENEKREAKLGEAEEAVGEEERATLADAKTALQAYLIAQGYPAAPVGSISPELDALVDLLI